MSQRNPIYSINGLLIHSPADSYLGMLYVAQILAEIPYPMDEEDGIDGPPTSY